ncbi:MAG: NrdH-redoxin [Salana multivorans]|uniref:glutaredoxin domain-containing protein n=1 Tax=Salana multivorans TaxID=120377 RepID=UPI0009665D01|nr:glutaredoxin domain-containing protein [Salana multivorans]MBN8883489.1 NrdH-redoxin [Salana multivorans]OJX96976.1 MAG: NrdH-redoxin [Micrococcales bacterium 73-15]
MTEPTPSPDTSPTTPPPDGSVLVYGADWCGDCRRTKAQLRALDVPFTWVDLVAEPERAEEARAISGRTNIPVVVYSDGSHQVEPSNADVAARLGELGIRFWD